ncbi:MAG: hypothetical protein P1T08_14110 [Acidimicrobiia bacterium]|nr:hypothetical protein [Acidimicrobiia bacterium]
MNTTISQLATGRLPVVTGVGLAALWLVLGVISDGTTYHLAPLLVAGLPASLYALENPTPLLRRSAGLAGLGTSAALVVTFVLAVTGNLGGPSLLPFGGAVTESVIFVLVGVAGGLAVGFLRSRKGSN